MASSRKTLKRSFISSRWRYSLKLFKWECSSSRLKNAELMLWLQCRGDSCKGLSTKALGNSVSGTYMSPKDLAKLLVSLCSFFLFRVNEYFKTNIPHVYLSTQTRTLFIQSVNVASCTAQFQAWASFNTSTKCNLPLEDTRFGECPLGFFVHTNQP